MALFIPSLWEHVLLSVWCHKVTFHLIALLNLHMNWSYLHMNWSYTASVPKNVNEHWHTLIYPVCVCTYVVPPHRSHCIGWSTGWEQAPDPLGPEREWRTCGRTNGSPAGSPHEPQPPQHGHAKGFQSGAGERQEDIRESLQSTYEDLLLSQMPCFCMPGCLFLSLM